VLGNAGGGSGVYRSLTAQSGQANLLRVDQIAATFGHDSTACISICNPYQHIASILRRRPRPPAQIAQVWLGKARLLMGIRQDYPFFPFISYEDFVADPLVVNDRMGLAPRHAVIAGKRGSAMAGIRSGYHRGVGFLQAKEVAAITSMLCTAPDVMDYFGYDLAGPDMLTDAAAANPAEFAIGAARRRAQDDKAQPGAQVTR
tara:strand:- start:9048 stop:9653 length:606 start_codon:yes stop_codon:yes gene_type:complete